jgi:hypothetical protein
MVLQYQLNSNTLRTRNNTCNRNPTSSEITTHLALISGAKLPNALYCSTVDLFHFNWHAVFLGRFLVSSIVDAKSPVIATVMSMSGISFFPFFLLPPSKGRKTIGQGAQHTKRMSKNEKTSSTATPMVARTFRRLRAGLLLGLVFCSPEKG